MYFIQFFLHGMVGKLFTEKNGYHYAALQKITWGGKMIYIVKENK